jgi:hypothetical protein
LYRWGAALDWARSRLQTRHAGRGPQAGSVVA